MTIGTVNIAYTIDCNAVLPCYVSVKSMLAHTKTKVDVYIVSDSPLPNKDRATLETLRSENANIEFITIDGTLFNNFPIGGETANAEIPLATYYRLYFPVCFSFDKIIYVDADTMFTDDIALLWQIDLNDSLVAGVPDKKEMQERRKNELGLNRDEQYINAGVQVMNLWEMRKAGLFQQCRQVVNNQRERIIYHDQDLLNLLCRGRIKILPYRWNLLADYLLKEPKEDDDKTRLLKDAQAHPAIIHFAGAIKPWQDRCWHPYQRKWRKYLSDSPYFVSDRTLKERLALIIRGYFYYFCLGPSPYSRPRE